MTAGSSTRRVQLALLVGASALALIGLEALLRILEPPPAVERHGFHAMDAPLYVADPQLGFRYRGPQTTHKRIFSADGAERIDVAIAINSAGQVSAFDVSPERHDGVPRVVVVGDSFTASLNNAAPWPDQLRARLATAEAPTVEVINLGLDGIGVVQMSAVVAREAPRWAPDLIVVVFITDDLYRRFVYRAEAPSPVAGVDLLLLCSTPVTGVDVDTCDVGRTFIVTDGTRPPPQRWRHLLSALSIDHARRRAGPPLRLLALAERALGSNDRAQENGLRITSHDEAVSSATRALREMTGARTSVLLVHAPSLAELQQGTARPPIVDDVERAVGTPIVSLAEALAPHGGEPYERYFNLPVDAHLSDEGARWWAAALAPIVARAMRERGTRAPEETQ